MHPSDADLQTLIDGEMDERRSRRVLAHLETCEVCRGRRRTLALGRQETAELLRSLDLPSPHASAEEVIRVAEGRRLPVRPGEDRTVLRAASVVGLLIAGAVAAAVVPGSPLREAIQRIVGDPDAGEMATPPAGDLWTRESGVALVPNGGLEVAFESGQTIGLVELIEAGGDTARVEVRGDSVGFLVGDGSVLVHNRGSGASYRVAVPSDLASVRIRIGARTVYEVVGGQILQDEFRQQDGARRLSLSGAP